MPELKEPVRLKNGDLDLDALWICEHCRKELPLRDTHLSWNLNIICADCAEKDEQ